MRTLGLDTPPRLAPPGAGLPGPELVVARLLFGWTLWRSSRERSTRLFVSERDRVLALAHTCGPETASRRVLIKRLPGMEDSSRYWSIWMTLEHLRLVQGMVAMTIDQLGKGIVPSRPASTAEVKPSPDIDGAVVEKFEQSCATLLQAAAALPDLNTAARYIHPWFGALDANGWYAMAGFHLNLHRQQIEKILPGLEE